MQNNSIQPKLLHCSSHSDFCFRIMSMNNKYVIPAYVRCFLFFYHFRKIILL